MVSSCISANLGAGSSSSRDALADIEVFITAAEAELTAMERERIGVHRRGRKPDPVLRRRLLGVIWMLTFGGMQWRLAGLLPDIPFTTLHSAVARWTRLGLWRRLGQRLALDWRIACGDQALASALVVDSRSQRSAPTCLTRGIDGGKNIKGIKLHVVCDEHGPLIDLEVTPANHDGRTSALPMLPRLAELGFQGDRLGDNGYKGEPFAAQVRGHDMAVLVSPGGTPDGQFIPQGVRWVVERLFAWLSRYRRLNTVFDRKADLFVSHFWIAIISILARRLLRSQAVDLEGV